jgi:methionine synthase II (cobalamin-independent)
MEQLGKKTDDFRTRQKREFEVKEIEKKESKARDQLVKFDEEIGVKVCCQRTPTRADNGY